MTSAPPAPETRPPRSGLRGVFNNFGWLAISRSLFAVLSLGYLAIATRALGVADFGRFMLVLSVSQAIVTFVQFQTWQVVVNFGMRHLAAGDGPALARLVRAATLLDAASAGAGAVIAMAGLVLAAGLFGLAGALVWQAALFALVLLVSIRSTPLGILRLHDRYKHAAGADSVMPVARLTGALLAWLLSPTVGGFLLAWGAAEIATAAGFWWAASRTGILGPARRARLAGRTDADNPGFARFVWTTNAGSSLGLAGKQVSTVLVGLYVGPVGAGQYRLAYQLAQSLTKLGTMLSRAMFPELARARHAGAGMTRMLGRLTLLSLASSGIVLVALAFGGRTLLTIVGGGAYVAALPLLIWLGAGACVDLAAVTFEPALMALGHAPRAFWVRLVATLVLLGLIVGLLPVLGARGAAVASFAGSVVAFVLLGLTVLWTLRRRGGVPARDVPAGD